MEIFKILYREANEAIGETPVKGNAVDISAVCNFDKPMVCHGFAIKYVTKGTEIYRLANKEIPVNEGQYLLINNNYNGRVIIDKEPAHGLCIDIAPDVVSEVLYTLSNPADLQPQNDFLHFLHTTSFYEHTYDTGQTHIGRFVKELAQTIDSGQQYHFSKEFFYTLAEKIILDQQPLFKQLSSIPGIKDSTKKELYSRLTKGKIFIEQNFSRLLTIEGIAKEAALSEYYFFRLFKTVFRQSPYQYISQLRLAHARNLIEQNNMSISEIARKTGFTDLHIFSKAFKRVYGQSPALYKSGNAPPG